MEVSGPTRISPPSRACALTLRVLLCIVAVALCVIILSRGPFVVLSIPFPDAGVGYASGRSDGPIASVGSDGGEEGNVDLSVTALREREHALRDGHGDPAQNAGDTMADGEPILELFLHHHHRPPPHGGTDLIYDDVQLKERRGIKSRMKWIVSTTLDAFHSSVAASRSSIDHHLSNNLRKKVIEKPASVQEQAAEGNPWPISPSRKLMPRRWSRCSRMKTSKPSTTGPSAMAGAADRALRRLGRDSSTASTPKSRHRRSRRLLSVRDAAELAPVGINVDVQNDDRHFNERVVDEEDRNFKLVVERRAQENRRAQDTSSQSDRRNYDYYQNDSETMRDQNRAETQTTTKVIIVIAAVISGILVVLCCCCFWWFGICAPCCIACCT